VSDIDLTINSTTDIALSVSSTPINVSLNLVGAQGIPGAVEGSPISDLTALSSVLDADILVIVSEGITKKVTALTLKTYFNT